MGGHEICVPCFYLVSIPFSIKFKPLVCQSPPQNPSKNVLAKLMSLQARPLMS